MKDMGLRHFSYRSDREPAVKVRIEEACNLAGRKTSPVSTDDLHESKPDVLHPSNVPAVELHEPDVPLADARVAVPEHSHAGGRVSNGLAERAVRHWED